LIFAFSRLVRSPAERRSCAVVALLVFAVGVGLVACGTPVGVKRMDPTMVQRQLTRSILSSDSLSNSTKNALFQHDLTLRWEDDPAGAIAVLQDAVARGTARRNDVYALAEVSFAYAEARNDPAYFRSAAVYAWLFLFPGDDTKLDPLDGRGRTAADIYNRALARGFESGEHGDFLPRAGSYPVPFGTLDVYFDESQLDWMDRRLVKFTPVAELDVEGMATRYRWSGLGAPLAASTEPRDPAKGYNDYVQPWAKVPVTALLKMSDLRDQLASGRVAGQLTLEQPIRREKVEIDGQEVALEAETTASLAYALAESPVWQREIWGFLQRMAAIDKGTQLAALQPYRPGRIPVVLVHGTASSPGRWAQMINELVNDRRIGPRIQVWLFMYDTGNPIGYSAMLLRESLKDMVKGLDPEGKDPALRDMVVIGHSQGGLLTKLAVVDTGDRVWKMVSDTPLDDLDMDSEHREEIRKIAFMKPVPNVTRVVFLSTPHHGSYIAGSWLAHQAARLIVMPANLTQLGTSLLTRNQAKLKGTFSGMQSSVYGMTPGNQFIDVIVDTPLAPGVTGHSIIAVKDPDVPLDKADDGVVEYTSAHIEGMESELVVTSGHSCQDNPHTINEVRRILLEHIKQFDAQQGKPAPAREPAAPEVEDQGSSGHTLSGAPAGIGKPEGAPAP
jgi:triacylglycerol esterase/lipase EstA (alpha/beta hydrolase family)